jgi:hypothetical protein
MLGNQSRLPADLIGAVCAGISVSFVQTILLNSGDRSFAEFIRYTALTSICYSVAALLLYYCLPGCRPTKLIRSSVISIGGSAVFVVSVIRVPGLIGEWATPYQRHVALGERLLTEIQEALGAVILFSIVTIPTVYLGVRGASLILQAVKQQGQNSRKLGSEEIGGSKQN